MQGRDASCFGRDHRREAPTKRVAGGMRVEVVLPHSEVVVLPTSARRRRPQKQVGGEVESVCIKLSLLAESSKLSEVAKDASVRKRGRGAPSDEARVVRAEQEQLASLGELSVARRAFESADQRRAYSPTD